jgi:hypothetical protein
MIPSETLHIHPAREIIVENFGKNIAIDYVRKTNN